MLNCLQISSSYTSGLAALIIMESNSGYMGHITVLHEGINHRHINMHLLMTCFNGVMKLVMSACMCIDLLLLHRLGIGRRQE